MLNTDWKGTNGNNFWQGRDGHKVVAIVDHIMQGTMDSTLSWFSNPKSAVSAHFGVAKDGRIWQFVELKNTAWANGIVQKPDLSIKWLAQVVTDFDNPNYFTVSIEHEGYTAEPMPEAQYQATLELHRYLLQTFSIPADAQHIIRHSQIDSVNKPLCPGAFFPMDRLLKELSMPSDKSFTDSVTNLTVKEPFASFYLANGGLPIFGRPITAIETGTALIPPCDKCQWFERARFELHGSTIMLGLVGREAYRAAL